MKERTVRPFEQDVPVYRVERSDVVPIDRRGAGIVVPADEPGLRQSANRGQGKGESERSE